MRCLAIALLVASTLSAQDLAIRGKTILPVSGPAIESGVILIENGKIKAIGRASEIAVPDGMTVLEAAVVTPGLIDAHSSAGLSGSLYRMAYATRGYWVLRGVYLDDWFCPPTGRVRIIERATGLP